MHCPRCETVVLTERERDGLLIDGCPTCRGVWLDRGELDKIIERSEAPAPAPRAQAAPPPPTPQPYREHGHHHDDRYYGKPYKKKYKSFLSELFD